MCPEQCSANWTYGKQRNWSKIDKLRNKIREMEPQQLGLESLEVEIDYGKAINKLKADSTLQITCK